MTASYSFIARKTAHTLTCWTVSVYLFAWVIGGNVTANATPTAAAREAINNILDKDWNAARSNVIAAHDPALNKFYEWSLYCDTLENLPFDRIQQFIAQNPHWPNQNKLLATAERNMPANYPLSSIVTWFSAHPPVTGQGIIRLMATGQAGLPIINASWPSADMTLAEQKTIMQEYGRYIRRSAHESRLDYLLRAEAYTLSRGLAASLGSGYPQLVEARIALIEGKSNAQGLMNAVPSVLQNNSGFLLDKAKRLRKNNNDRGAISILSQDMNLASMTFPEDWWKERNIMARRAIEDGKYSEAYTIASRHGATEGAEYAEGEWLSGWLALRFLNKPSAAYTHFTNMYNKVETAISRARGAYWSGRAAEALGKKPEAQTWFYQAANYPHTYYGQIAQKHLKIATRAQMPAISTSNDTQYIASMDLVQMAVLLHQTNNESLSTRFLNSAIDKLERPSEFQALATYLKRMGDMSGAYRVAKRASWKNIFLGDTAYPSLMKWIGPLNIDPSLAHGIIRQESQFDTTAQSPSGALGLMQLMPATAKEVARKRGWEHQTSWLVSRPDHNILLGSAYLNDLLGRYNNSYPLAIAAYNAGPSRVNGWLEHFGDPRQGDINWIDWLELIPYTETRNYVQRVTEGIVTYRDHLGIVNK